MASGTGETAVGDDATFDELEEGLDSDADQDDYEPGDVNTLPSADYEPGDVNTIGSSPRAGGGAGSAGPDGGLSVDVLEYLARAMSDEPDAVTIRKEERRGSTVLRLRVAPGDMGRVIGRRGRTAQAIRTLIGVAGVREGVQATVDIADD